MKQPLNIGLAAAGLALLLVSQATAAEPAPPGAAAGAPETAPISPDALPDWPCVQRKVETLTVAQLWDGPPVDEKGAAWREVPEINNLIPTLASRRVPLEQAEVAVSKFAESVPEASRDERLTLLFSGLLQTVNNERKTVIKGIERYVKAQQERAAKLETDGVELAKLQEKALSDEAVAAQLQSKQEDYDWQTRIFQERQGNIPLACEIPVLIDERVYALARAIRSHMKS